MKHTWSRRTLIYIQRCVKQVDQPKEYDSLTWIPISYHSLVVIPSYRSAINVSLPDFKSLWMDAEVQPVGIKLALELDSPIPESIGTLDR